MTLSSPPCTLLDLEAVHVHHCHRPSTGLLGVAFALSTCEKVHLFGFANYSNAAAAAICNHYYDCRWNQSRYFSGKVGADIPLCFVRARAWRAHCVAWHRVETAQRHLRHRFESAVTGTAPCPIFTCTRTTRAYICLLYTSPSPRD